MIASGFSNTQERGTLSGGQRVRVTELDSWSSVKKSKHEKRETCEVTKDNCLNDVTLVLDFSRETEYKKD